MEYSSGWNYSSIVVKLEHWDSGLAIWASAAPPESLLSPAIAS
jgi:hypothetical protein